MLELLKTMLTGQNALASGGLLFMIIGGLSVYLRAVPERLWYWIVGQTTMMITVKDDDAAFVWVKEWFLEQKFLRRIRRVDLDTTMRNERISLIPAPGLHWFWYEGRPFQVWFSRTESAHERIARRMESLTFRTIGRKRVFLPFGNATRGSFEFLHDCIVAFEDAMIPKIFATGIAANSFRSAAVSQNVAALGYTSSLLIT
jgi:chaperone BCS1